MKLPNIPGKKQLLGILLSLGILAAMIVPVTQVSAANSTATMYLSPATVAVSGTTPVTVSVKLDTDYNVNQWGFNLQFDATKLQVSNVQINSIWGTNNDFPQSPAIVDNVGGYVVGASDASRGQTTPTDSVAPYTLATMTFTPVAGQTGTATISFVNTINYFQTTSPYGYGSGTNEADDSVGTPTISSLSTATFTGTSVWTFPSAPTLTSIVPNTGKTGDTITINGTSLTGATAVTFNSTAVTTGITVNGAGTSLTFAVPNLGTSNLPTVSVTVTNAIGPSNALTFSYFATPGSISLNTAYAKSEDTLTITGTNFTNDANTTLTINGASAARTYVSATSLTAVVPALGSTNIAAVAVVVTTPGGSGTAHFDYVAAPTVINPVNPGLPGTTLTITGTNFYSATGALATVTFGSTAGTNVAAVNSTTITVTIPNLGTTANATSPFTVTTYGGSASGTFSYTALGINSFSPASAMQGATVTINGAGFTGTTGVLFGTTNAASFSVDSTGSVITAVVPYMGLANSAKITVNVGAASTLSATNFTYIPQLGIAVAQQTTPPATGSTFSVLLNINTNGVGVGGIRAWQANLSFDATQVSCTGISVPMNGSNPADFLGTYAYANSGSTLLGGVSGGLTTIINNYNGTITALGNAILGAGTNGPTGQGVLAVLTFQVNSPGSIDSLPSTWLKISNVIVDDSTGSAIANVFVSSTSNIQLPSTNQVTFPGTSQSDTVDATLGDQLTLISPASIAGWNMVVSSNNNVQRTLNVFANTNWALTVAATNNGHLTQINSSGVSTGVQLANPLSLLCDAGNGGTGGMVNMSGVPTLLATGTNLGQNVANGGDIRNVLFNQAVTYTDPTTISTNAASYHVVVTFIATNTSW